IVLDEVFPHHPEWLRSGFDTTCNIPPTQTTILSALPAHGFALWPSCEDFSAGHPYQYCHTLNGPWTELVSEDALRDTGIDARVVVEAVDREESETGTRGPIVVRVGRVIGGVQREQGRRIIGVESEVTTLTERIAELERDNKRLRGTTSVESQRVDRLQRGMKMPNTQSRASITHEEVEELVVHRVAEEMEAREAAMNLKPLNENGDEQEGNGDGGNGENGNGNRNRNHGMNYGGFMPVTQKNEIQKMENKLWNLMVKGNDLTAFTQRFQELILLCTRMVPDKEDRVERFIRGLPDSIQGNVIVANPARLQDAIRIAN
nr:reverse transcriptase domain-containing protein [Tanacetum cinerariifolium]